MSWTELGLRVKMKGMSYLASSVEISPITRSARCQSKRPLHVVGFCGNTKRRPKGQLARILARMMASSKGQSKSNSQVISPYHLCKMLLKLLARKPGSLRVMCTLICLETSLDNLQFVQSTCLWLFAGIIFQPMKMIFYYVHCPTVKVT